ncbi:MAG: potassium channel protein [Bacteroidales bacterium]|nr:potassium channel protein [Bacteroidales bacterium]MCF8327975.1 potassium channel protein [Bacteroidales bacterium]
MLRFITQSDRFRKLRIAVLLMFIVILTGVVGYIIIEDSTFLDALYMTVITISTVGFKEVYTLSELGQTFTIFIIIISWITLAYSVSVITTYLIEGEMNLLFSSYRKKSEIKKMENHVIVVGYGRNGRQAVHDLLESKQDFVIIERDHQLVLNNTSNDIKFYEGDASDDEIMLDVGVKKARAIIITLPDDANNLFIALTARSLNPNIYIISRATSESTEKKLEMAGVNHVIMPEKVGGSHMAALVTKPDLVHFLGQISLKGDHETNLDEIMCDSLSKDKKETTIGNLNIRSLSGANIVGFKTPEGKYIINPSPETRMMPNSKLFVMGTPEQIDKMKRLLKTGKV